MLALCVSSLVAAGCLFALTTAHCGAQGGEVPFGAYYTQLHTGQPWEDVSRTDRYADVVVRAADSGGSLVFWRGNSYLPYWKTAKGQWNLPEIFPRTGDGAEPMPDRCNVYSHVEVIENTSAKVVVLWRYLRSFVGGNPHREVDPSHFVEETFTLTPDGKVGRVIKQATEKIDEWNDPLNQIEQHLQLTTDGVVERSRRGPDHSPAPGKTTRPPMNNARVDTALRFAFDEGAGAETTETITGTTLPVAGPKALWKKGISGTALEFDGYQSAVVLPGAKAPPIAGGSLTLEGWTALGAYPWNWAPLVQQGDDRGYFLGVDSHGYPGFMVMVDGVWQQLTVPNAPPYQDANHLGLFQWYHLAGTYRQQDGMMRLYVNGREVASRLVGTGGVQTVNADVRIGQAGILRVPTEGTHDTKPSRFGLDGLIDEVRIYSKALDAAEIVESYHALDPGPKMTAVPDMQKRQLPTFTGNGKFQAVHTHLPYYESWDSLWRVGKFADLVVGFDRTPCKFVFWRGTNYIPMLVNEANQWYMNEFNETGFTKDARGDCEPMSDKPCLDSHVRLLENTAARVVVHWRYRLANPDHQWAYYDDKTGWGDTADWYYYIYPDGVASKRMRCYSSRPETWHEWDEQIVVFGEGQHPESVISKVPVMTLVDGVGKAYDYDWNPNPPKPAYAGKIIQMIHLKGKYSPFTIQAFDGGDIYKGERTWYSVFPSWNHWPTSQIDSSGRNATFPDRAAHASISHLFWPYSGQQKGDVSFQEKNLLEGMTDQPAASLTDLAKSWLNAPGVSAVSGGESQGYDRDERAYGFKLGAGPLSFQIDASAEHPIHHLCFRIRNWPDRNAVASLKIDGVSQAEGPNFRQGLTLDTDGTATMIIWAGVETRQRTSFQVQVR